MKKQVILMSLAIAGSLCCIPMFVLNAPGAPGLSGGAASLLGMAGAVLFGTCAGTLLQLKRLSGTRTTGRGRRPNATKRNQAIRDRASASPDFWTVGLLVVSGLIFQSFERFGIPRLGGLGVHRHLSVLHFGVPGALQMAPAEDVRRRCHEAEHTLVSLGRRGGGAPAGRPLGARTFPPLPPLCRGFLALQAASCSSAPWRSCCPPETWTPPGGSGTGRTTTSGAP